MPDTKPTTASSMRYAVNQSFRLSYRAMYHSIGKALILIFGMLALICAALVLIGAPDIMVGFLLGAMFLVVVSFVILLEAANRNVRKVYGDSNGNFQWTYTITKDYIEVSIADKLKVRYPISGLKTGQMLKHGAFFMHDRLPFFVPFPDGRKEEVLDQLTQYGWIKPPRRSLAAQLITLLIVGLAAGAAAYFMVR